MIRKPSYSKILYTNIKAYLLLIFLLLSISTFSQNSYFNQDEWRSNYFVNEYELDLPKAQRNIENNGGPFQFAIPVNVNKSIYLGDENNRQDGYYHYFQSINVNDAKAINFTLTGLKDAKVYSVYVNAKNQLFGPYFPSRNQFDITPFSNYYTDELTIEIISKKVIVKEQVNLFRVGVVYDLDLLRSSECLVDVNCSQGDYWQDVKQSVVRIQFNNGYLCSGTILNNTMNDETPFLLTANHCISNQQSAANAIFGFNYEAPYCNAPANEYPGVSSNRLVGATLRATKNDAEGRLDFTLLELNDSIPEHFNVHFAGWSASKKAPKFVAGIHHPGGDVKKISVDYNELIKGSFSEDYDLNSFWRVLQWDVGVTEGGSSGSAIFNVNKQVVGDLTGGEAACDYPYNDFYARFDLAFDKYVDSSQQLKYWLDQARIDVESWYGLPYDQIRDSVKVQVYPNPAHRRIQVYSPTLSGMIKITLYDTNGVIVWNTELEVTDRILFVDIPANLLGLYYMRLVSDNTVVKKKVVFY